jgi:hypothetical protein
MSDADRATQAFTADGRIRLIAGPAPFAVASITACGGSCGLEDRWGDGWL